MSDANLELRMSMSGLSGVLSVGGENYDTDFGLNISVRWKNMGQCQVSEITPLWALIIEKVLKWQSVHVCL